MTAAGHSRGLKEAADLGYLTNRETRHGRAARYRIGPDGLPEDKPALPADLPDDTGAHTRTGRTPIAAGQRGVCGCAGVRGGTGKKEGTE